MASIVRRNQGWVPSLFSDLLPAEWLDGRGAGVTPAINVKENKKEYTVEVAAPGLTKEDFSVHLNDQNDLVVTLEKRAECHDEDKECHYLRREFSYSKFQQTMLLPEDVDRGKIEAEVERGILHIHLPKRPEAERKHEQRKIDIK
ncbi:MAG: Hsp20/alpha crystallin family protein [Tidjanibacter sp.]|nr:Hsp20/alpha crystallin family protein [Tidjanibacter sp.]